jgi:hypothetical protein
VLDLGGVYVERDMNKNLRFRTGKILIRVLLATLLVLLAQPAAPALAGRQDARVGGALASDLLRSDGALDLTTGFRGVLDLRGWKVTLDAQRGPLFRPLGSPAFTRTAAPGTWSALGTGTNGIVRAIAVSGSSVYVGGDFTSVGTCTTGCNNIAMWNGTTWSALGTGMDGVVRAIAVSGANVYAGGDFTSAGTCTTGCNSIAMWNGAAWSALGTGMAGTNPSVYAIVANGNNIYTGGYFASAGTCTTGCANIAIWNSITSTWSAMGTGMGGDYPFVYTIVVVSSTNIYAGGDFTSAGTCTSGCNKIARWNGTTWSALGTGANDTVYAIAVSGSNVYAGGVFTSAGTCTNYCLNIAKWDGSTWSALGTGMQNGVYSIVLNGSNLYVGGWFSYAGNCVSGCTNIAKWDGLAWSALGTGTNNTIRVVAVSGSVLYAGGYFTSAGTCTSGCNRIARYDLASNANLSSLELSSGTLAPTFASTVITYTAAVGNGVTDTTITPTAADLGATIQVRINSGAWSAVPSGSPSVVLSLNVGDNPINVLVIAENGLVTKTYTITVTRAQPSMMYIPLVLK